MDLATLVGLIAAFGVIGASIMLGGDFGLFVNAPSIMIVFGGAVAVAFVQFPMKSVFGAFSVAVNAFVSRTPDPIDIIKRAVELAGIVRKEGLLSLEEQEVDDPFFEKGLGFCVDGHPPEFVRKVLTQDMAQTVQRHESGQSIWKAIGGSAPAMGMIGTLIGLVQMLANMDDPKSIGPAMAVALLTTLYGALIANVVALPIAGKLEVRSDEERLIKSLIIEAIAGIQEGVNPRVMDETLRTFLPSKQREAVGQGEAVEA